MKDQHSKPKEQTETKQPDYNGLDPEMSLLYAKFATTDNDYFNEYERMQQED